MNGSSGELCAWLQRAESRVRSMSQLPGEWGVTVSTEPPISEADADRLAAELPLGLPAPLRALYVEGAGKFDCRYSWSPRPKMLKEVERVFPHQYSFYGGPSFIGWSELANMHGIHDWWDEWDAPATKKQENGRKIWRQTVPFIGVGNGDVLGLHVTGESDVYPVVYLCHDCEEDPVVPVSPSFNEFLCEWEKLCYVGPEIWLLSRFLGRGKALSGDGIKARKWREILNFPAETERR